MGSETIDPDFIDRSYVPIARPSVTGVELEGEGLLYDEDRASWHLLSPTAMVIWQCCDGSGTVDELAHDLAKAYQADSEAVRIETLEAVRQLGHQGLLAGVEGEAPGINGAQAHEHNHQHETQAELGKDQSGHGPRFLPVPPSS